MLDNLPLLVVLTVVVAVALGGLLAFRSTRRGASRDRDLDLPPPPRTLSPEEEMRALGIVDIRPVQRTARPAPPEAAPAIPDAPRPATPPVLPPPPPSLAPEGTRVRRPFFDDDLSTEDALRGGTEHLLQALHFATRAHTTGLLRQEGTRGAYRYVIESLYSNSAFARASGTYTTRTPLVPAGEHHPVLHRASKSPLPFEALRYYREDLTALRTVLAAPFRAHGHTHLIVLDAKDDDRFDSPRVRDLVEATARMLALLRPVPDTDAVHPDLTRPDVPAEPPASAFPDPAPWTPPAAPAETPPAPAPAPAAAPPAAPVIAVPDDAPADETPDVVETPALAAYHDTPVDEPAPPVPVTPAAPTPVIAPPVAPPASVAGPAPGTVARPSRRSILAAELSRASATGLTLALVGLDDPSTDDDDDALADTEVRFEARLRETAPGRRIERFADLCFGVFLPGTGDDIDAWVEHAFGHLSHAFPGVAVALGAACFPDTSLSPDQARAHAETALRKSSDLGGPVVFGGPA